MATDIVSDVGEHDVPIEFILHLPWRIVLRLFYETSFDLIWFASEKMVPRKSMGQLVTRTHR